MYSNIYNKNQGFANHGESFAKEISMKIPLIDGVHTHAAYEHKAIAPHDLNKGSKIIADRLKSELLSYDYPLQKCTSNDICLKEQSKSYPSVQLAVGADSPLVSQ